MTTVSIIIPTYNRAHLIEATLRSLLAQSRLADEIIVVDDGSTDSTPSVVERIGGQVRLICQSRNAGPGAARNIGLAQARGSHILFFDSDDLATPDYVAARVRVAEQTSAQIVYGSWIPVRIEGEICQHDGFVRQSRPHRRDGLSAFLNSWTLFLPNCLIERSLLELVGGYPTDLRTGEDMLLLFRLLKAGAVLAFAPGPLLLVRQHPKGQISASPEFSHDRAREELVMTSRVIEELNKMSTCSARSVRAWRGRRAASLIRALKADPAVTEDFGSASLGDLLLSQLWLLRNRFEAAFTNRIFGHSIPKILEPAPITGADLERIRALGFDV